MSEAGFVELFVAVVESSHNVNGGGHRFMTPRNVYSVKFEMEQYGRLIFAFTIAKNSINPNLIYNSFKLRPRVL
jgi:hypothetical protein